MDKTWNLNQAARKRNTTSMKALMEQIKRDITIAGNNPNALSELKFFTHVNLITSKNIKTRLTRLWMG